MTQNRVEIDSVEKQISKLIDRLVEAESTAVVSAYEAKVENLERRKAVLKEKVAKCGRPQGTMTRLFKPLSSSCQTPGIFGKLVA